MQNCERLDADMKSESYWTYEVLSIEGEKKRSLVISPCDTLAQAMAGAFKDATYYIGVCGYKVALSFHECARRATVRARSAGIPGGPTPSAPARRATDSQASK